ncbi:MAG: hypothetical protein HOP19_14110 [Acidobacteria bacterium]|nr:hypothetical protein [Acidobacteriota bacterium]
MQNQNDQSTFAPTQETDNALASTEAVSENNVAARKPFVDPAVSDPTDILEVTKFFAQAVSSGNLP